MQGLCESIKNIYGKYDIQTYIKGNKTLRTILVTPKDKDQRQQKVVLRWYKCNRLDCNKEYIGESTRTFGKRFKEYLKGPFSHTRTPTHCRPPQHIGQLENCKQGGAKHWQHHCQTHIHKDKQPHSYQAHS